MSARRATLSHRPHTLDELLFWAPSLLRRDTLNEWERGFVVSMLGASKRRGWRPTDKQERTLRGLVETLFSAAPGADSDVLLIDHDAA